MKSPETPVPHEEGKKRFEEIRLGKTLPPKTIEDGNTELQLLNINFTPMPDDVLEVLHSGPEGKKLNNDEDSEGGDSDNLSSKLKPLDLRDPRNHRADLDLDIPDDPGK